MAGDPAGVPRKHAPEPRPIPKVPDNVGRMTPMMAQYLEIKRAHADAILLFRMGDFYETFWDDAKTASKELDIVLTSRSSDDKARIPMAGVPYHSVEPYIARLVKKGYKVAICEQLEDPKKVKGIVKRDVIRVITPGTAVDDYLLEGSSNNFLAAIIMDRSSVGLSFVDVSTGEFFATGYRLFFDEETGPKLGPFLADLDREFVLRRLRREA